MRHFIPPLVKVRNAKPSDAPVIAELGERFHAEAGWNDIVDYVRDDCELTIRHMIENEDGICIVAERDGRIIGMAGGLAYPFYFNHAHRTGMELFWWVEPAERSGAGRELLDALEAEAARLGCLSFTMIALDKVKPELTGHIYGRRGYRASEHSWIRRL